MHVVERLEFNTIRSALAARTRTPLGTQLVEGLIPLDSRSEAVARIELISEARTLLQRADEPPVAGASDVSQALALGLKGSVLDGTSLRAIAETMRAGSRLRRFLLPRSDDVPGLYAIGAALPDLARIADELGRCFGPDGELLDEASPTLGGLRKRMRSFREAIKEKLGELLHSPHLAPVLQETYFTIRGDRYVLPVKASFKNEVRGIVHDASNSGQTVFIEPQAIVDLGNSLKIAQSEVTEEEFRILSELTELAVSEPNELRATMAGVGRVDFLAAAARFGDFIDAAPIVPSETPGFDLIDARHPLLVINAREQEGPRVIANDIGLTAEQRILVVTGPNTGGKTVAMKTVGLLALMVRAGLHIPANPRSKLGWFDEIAAEIGDEQSITEQLSTFAAHMKGILRLLERTSARSLILIDEIAADTDPNQGQALAQALLERFASRGAHVIVTTHFERLKAIAYADTRFRNAGVGFDPARLRPTYRLALDMPQGSSGLEIAQSLGLPGDVIGRARELAGQGQTSIDSLTRVLQQKSVELDEAKSATEAARRELAQEHKHLKQMERDLVEKRRELLDLARRDLLEEINKSREQVRDIVAQLQRSAAHEVVREAMRSAHDAQQALEAVAQAEAERLIPYEEPKEAPEEAIRVGSWIHVNSLAKDGEVVAVDSKGALVAVGAMRTRVSLDGLSRAQGKRPKKTRHESSEFRRGEESRKSNAPGPTRAEELDLRGHSVDEALSRLDGFLDHHYRDAAGQVRIIHGHGSGVLRTAIRDYLKRSGYVRQYRAGDEDEGGDGVTLASLS